MSTPENRPPEPIGPGLLWALPPELRLDEQPLELVLPGDPITSLTTAGNLYLKADRRESAPAPKADQLIELAVELWRLEKRLEAGRSEFSAKTQRALDSSAKRLRGVLDRAGLEWRDPTGETYSDGMRSVRVLAFEPTEGIAAGQRIIIETVRPAVYSEGRVAAVGEVIVGTAIEESKGEQHDPTDD